MEQYKNKLHRFAFSLLEMIRASFSGLGLRKIGIIGKTYNFLFSRFKPTVVEVEGNKMELDPLDTLVLYKSKKYEDYVTSVCKKEVRAGDVVVDLGAHIGYYTLLFARLVGERGRVFAFEPSSETFRILKRNVELNAFKNVTLEQKGVSDGSGKTRFFLYGTRSGSPYNSLGTALYEDYNPASYEEIDVVSLDDYFGRFNGRIDFLKMDVEGAEGLVLDGMKKILSRNMPMKIVTEVAPTALQRVSNIKAIEYIQKFLDFGFEVSEFDTRNRRLIPLWTSRNGNKIADQAAIYRVLEKCNLDDGKWGGTNLFCSR